MTIIVEVSSHPGAPLGYVLEASRRQLLMLLMAGNANGTVIQDAATDGNPKTEEASAAIGEEMDRLKSGVRGRCDDGVATCHSARTGTVC
ncbi:hypothetical protein [Nitrosovibrio sp. Nv4]|uniref:hypothetical protein n=1 Tax=Nitrosovibrio sp. Nv4 TaxID=1945880 RepID=UPI000BD05A30|nr:hypothetical protein [Nitrosovibrio sp. Nv4]SOD41515.1 hypothetical protein SAMN06298226_1815 [Nitrosovibrio sp. Nv4]